MELLSYSKGLFICVVKKGGCFMASEKVVTLTKENFKDYLSKDLPLLVDFWASWCGPCQMLGPVIDEVANEYFGKLIVGKVNVDEQPDLAREFKIMTIPAVFVIKNGEIADKLNGAVSLEQMEDFIEENI